MPLLHVIAVVLIVVTVLFVGILPLLAVSLHDDEDDTQKIRRTN